MIKAISYNSNKTNTKRQSFGATVVSPMFYNELPKESKDKVKQIAENLCHFFPLNDIYIDKSHNKDGFSYKVQQAHPITLLAHPGVFPAAIEIFKTPENVLNYIKSTVMLDLAQKRIWRIKEPTIEKEITDIKSQKAGTILATMMNEIKKFNAEQQKKNPGS